MKAKTNKKQSSALLSRLDEQRSETQTTTTEAQPQVAPAEQAGGQSRRDPARILPYVNFKQRDGNRALATEKALDLLRQRLPTVYDLAEVVGKWVWVTFPDQPAEQVRGQLSQFGFRWNNSRKCWQHQRSGRAGQPARPVILRDTWSDRPPGPPAVAVTQ